MVDGGGGSNILRGGKRAFDCKTLVGNYVEEAYRPNAIRASWHGGEQFTTTTQQQMQQSAAGHAQQHTHALEFGAALDRTTPQTQRYDYHQIVGADTTRGASTWISLAHSAHANSAQPTEFAAPREMKGRRMPEDELERHRAQWTRENEQMARQRFVTEMAATQDPVVPPRFRKEMTRPTQQTFH